MTRTPTHRYSALPRSTVPIKRSPLRRQSAKARAGQRELKLVTPVIIGAAKGRCLIQSPVCTGAATVTHHVRRRDRNHGNNHRENGLASCWSCNGYVEDHPKWAQDRGFKVRVNGEPLRGAKFNLANPS